MRRASLTVMSPDTPSPAPAPGPESLTGRTLRHRSLRGSRFVGCDLSEVVVRGSELAGLELDSPWLLEGDGELLVNGVNVIPLVDAELNRRFPGRELRTASDSVQLRAAWTALERAWAATLERAAAMPDGTVDASVDGEWSLAQTLRHLVMATDTWLGRAILELEHPYHPAGLPNDGESAAYQPGDFTTEPSTFAEVLAVRADRQAMVREFLGRVTGEQLSSPRRNPHDAQGAETVLSCLHTILEEEWEHHRYAVRDLDQLTARSSSAEPT